MKPTPFTVTMCVLLAQHASARLSSRRTEEDFEAIEVVAGGATSTFIPLQLGPGTEPVPVSEQDIFRAFKLDIADGENPIKDHVFTGETEAVPFVNSLGYSKVVQTAEDVTETMGISGSLSVSYGPMISGSGAGSFMKENIASKNQVSYIFSQTQTAFARKALVQTIQPDGFDVSKGTKFIDSIIFGAQLDIRYTISSTEEIDTQEIEAALQGSIGVGPLSIEFSANFESQEGESSSRFEMEIEAKASGVPFFIPPTLTFDNFEEVNGYIELFNAEFRELFDGLAEQETIDTEANILQEMSPIGFTLSESADFTDALDVLDSLALDKRLEDLQTVFYEALEWKETLRRSLEFAEINYGQDPFLRDTIFKPYEAFALEYDAKIDDQIDQCLAFRASALTSNEIPDKFPTGFDETVLEGLTGQVFIPPDLSLLGETYEGLHYIGFAIPDGDVDVKPWMEGAARNFALEEVATGTTPEELKSNLDALINVDLPTATPTPSPTTTPTTASPTVEPAPLCNIVRERSKKFKNVPRNSRRSFTASCPTGTALAGSVCHISSNFSLDGQIIKGDANGVPVSVQCIAKARRIRRDLRISIDMSCMDLDTFLSLDETEIEAVEQEECLA